MLTVLLIRHGTGDHVGQHIAGRAPGVHLNALGRLEAGRLAEALAGLGVEAVYSGPLERAMETAAALAERLGLPIRLASGLDELDFGEWTGRTLTSLEGDPRWEAFNHARASTRIPGGELMREATDRAIAELERFQHDHPDGLVAAVSHGDVIRGVLLRCLELPLDAVHRLEVAPASVSVLRMFPDARRVAAISWTVGTPTWEGRA